MRAITTFSLILATQFVFAQDVYVNPVDGKSYIADWKTYHPEGGVKEQKGRVVNTGVRFLNTQADFEKNVTVEQLSKLIGFIQHVLTKQTESYSEGGEILLQIELSNTDSPKFKMSYQGELKQELLQKFYDSLSVIELKTKLSVVNCQVHFLVKNA
ncbi:MAG: hypothetical protein ABW101_03835 [Candidatus Thiodiazotropha sp.]